MHEVVAASLGTLGEIAIIVCLYHERNALSEVGTIKVRSGDESEHTFHHFSLYERDSF